jgi:Gon7 family
MSSTDSQTFRIRSRFCLVRFGIGNVDPELSKFTYMTTATAQYTSPTHSLNVAHPVVSADGSQKSSLEALRQAVLATQADLNVFLTERKLEEDRKNGVNGTKRKIEDDDDGEDEEDEANEDEEEE